MTDKRWTEEDIEKTLSDMPALKDKQSKESIMQAIEEKNEGAMLLRSDKKKKPPWAMPVAAAAAALFLVALLLPSMLNGGVPMSGDNDADQNNMAATSDDVSDDRENVPQNDQADDGEESREADLEDNHENGSVELESDNNSESQETPDIRYPVLSTEVIDQDGDFVVGIQPGFSETVETIDEAVLTTLQQNDPTSNGGFSALSAVEIEGSEAALFFEEESLAGLTSAEHQILTRWFDEIFTLYGITNVRFSTPERESIQFGQVGEIEEMDIENDHGGYYLNESDGGPLIVRAQVTDEERSEETDDPASLNAILGGMTETTEEADWYFSASEFGIELTGIDISEDEVILMYTVDPEVTPEEIEQFYQVYRFAVTTFEVEELTFLEEETEGERIYRYENNRIVDAE
ncbi:hypothetical protein [Salisediminibacterium beveridgei]|uniref:Uncharacterized protein n=1 Tax=Salisediminibacterium beveridgei TaxID=632773 RepID=A0A1D7QYR9_9BACI|nr:hypothetical protein [Salisediminibacterium beveridgei]AOM84151.1 hypothetical protein BBEV_2826 [Salisediminibacterium beveridgei]